MKIPDDLLPGDLLVYGPKSWHVYQPFRLDLFNQITIRRTAWGYGCHVEVYHGSRVIKPSNPASGIRGGTIYQSTASRNGLGVELYPFRRDQLIAVRRPIQHLNYLRAWTWFMDRAKGQKYDWLGLLCFTYAVKSGSPKHMFCSEYATRFYRMARINPVEPNMDADTVAPNDLLKSMAFRTVWTPS